MSTTFTQSCNLGDRFRYRARANELLSYQTMIAGLRNEGVEVSAVVPDSTLQREKLRIERRTRVGVRSAS